MFAKTADELRQMMRDNPGVSPSTFLRDDSFAAWCYDNRDRLWLKAAFNRDADPEDCRRWGISAAEWKADVEMAGVAWPEIDKMPQAQLGVEDKAMNEDIEYKSKTQKKKEAEALQKLGLKLAALSVPQLERIDIPEKLRAALIEGKSISAKVAARRHRQFIGVLMRTVDPESVRRALDGIDDGVPVPASGSSTGTGETVDRLVAGGSGEMQALLEKCPHLDRQRLRQLVRNVQKEKPGAKPSKSRKALEEMLGEAGADHM